MTTYILLLQMATGIVAIDIPSRERCEYILSRVKEKGVVVKLKDGTEYAIPRDGGIACVPKEYEEEAAS